MTLDIRFVHAADLHLDAPFKGVNASDPRVREALVASTYAALDALVASCVEHRADFLVIAGDVYNASDTSLRAQFAFRDACVRLAEAGIPVYLARGNHDPAGAGTLNRLPLPENVHEFSTAEVERVVFERADGAACAIYGRSFRSAAESSNLAAGFRRRPEDAFAVGVLHTNAGGRPDYEPYAPCSLDDLRAAGMDYWALGHIHKPEVLFEAPAIVYSGCTQGLTPNESGPRGCSLVTLGSHGASTEFVPTASLVWDRTEVDLSECEDLSQALSAGEAAIEALSARSGGRPLIARLTLQGRTAAHAALIRPGALADIVAELRASALAREPWVWLDAVADRTRPLLDVDALRDGQDLAGDLVRLADALANDDASLAEFVGSLASPVLERLDARDRPALDAADLLQRGRDLALDRLTAGEDR